eukprot:GCRY01000258.1.p1 GENE.GCRY01000258.1~~GCRY01000258.1.p1  ORF type:complete len:235 (+),score=15.79 GCRY01000258.1:333-1037(+)
MRKKSNTKKGFFSSVVCFPSFFFLLLLLSIFWLSKIKNMGNCLPRSSRLTKKELKFLLSETHFTQVELKELFVRFRHISKNRHHDGVIGFKEFQTALGLKDIPLVTRIFNVFDVDRSATIDFREFTRALSIMSPRGTLEEKLLFSFQIYDSDRDGNIDREELAVMLKAALDENVDMELTDSEMDELIDLTFQKADLDGDGRISYDEYKTLYEAHQARFLAELTVEYPFLCSNRK